MLRLRYVQRVRHLRIRSNTGIGIDFIESTRSMSEYITLENRQLTHQLIRDGNHTVADLMSIGKTMLGRRHVLPSVISSLVELQVEGTFPTGTYLVTVHHPISTDEGDLEKALYGSFLPVPPREAFPDRDPADYKPENQPGAVITVKNSRITLSEGRKRIKLKVTSKGDRPIQVLPPSLRVKLSA